MVVPRRRANTTRHEIVQLATKLFLEIGYSATTPKRICDVLNISTGNLTYYFSTKDHLLAVLVEMLCAFQRKNVQDTVGDGKTSLLAVCMELATMAAMCEEDDIAKELFLAMYSSPLCLEIIRRSDNERAKFIYSDYCSDWTEEQFAEAEILVSGIEYATMMITADSVTLETRIVGALDAVMQIYSVPEAIRREKIRKIMDMDYRALGRHVLKHFREFVEQINEQTFEALVGGTK